MIKNKKALKFILKGRKNVDISIKSVSIYIMQKKWYNVIEMLKICNIFVKKIYYNINVEKSRWKILEIVLFLV